MENVLLRSLLRVLEQDRLPGSEPISLKEEEVLYEPESEIEYVYFPVDCAISLFGTLDDGSTVELASVGREGLVGVSALNGRHRTFTRAVVQVRGTAIRMRARTLKETAKGVAVAGYHLLSYVDLLLAQSFLAGTCNRFHTAERRLARFLLRHRDATGHDCFRFTQEFMAVCLGTDRTTVVAAVSNLERAGFVRHERSQVEIVDHRGLEARACECYARLKLALAEYMNDIPA